MIKKLEVQFGSAGPEIHPEGDSDGEIVLADINPDAFDMPGQAENFAHQLAGYWNNQTGD